MTTSKVALVTGANRGLGLEISRQLAKQGILVLMGCRSAAKGRKAVRELLQQGLPVEFIRLDVTKPDQIKGAAAMIRKRFTKLDILVNNAGVSDKDEPLFGASIETVAPAAMKRTFATNVFGLVELTQKLLPLIKKSEAGRIVNMSSIMGSLTIHSTEGAMPFKPFAYDSSKTAVNAFTIHLASALAGTTVKVNSCHPGWVRTDMGGPRAPLTPEAGARTAVWLATLGPDGPTGKFFHEESELPW